MVMGRSAGSVTGMSFTGGIIAPVTNKEWMDINSYIDGLHESIARAKEFLADVPMTSGHSKLMEDIQAQQAQTSKAMAQISTIFSMLHASMQAYSQVLVELHQQNHCGVNGAAAEIE